VLTLSCARTILRSVSRSGRLGARVGAVAALFALSPVLASSSVRADGLVVGGCVGSFYSFSCVKHWGSYSDPYIRLVPHPQSEAEKAISAERDHKWQARCHPAVFQDYYGVPRYQYAARGCEFGVIE